MTQALAGWARQGGWLAAGAEFIRQVNSRRACQAGERQGHEVWLWAAGAATLLAAAAAAALATAGQRPSDGSPQRLLVDAIYVLSQVLI